MKYAEKRKAVLVRNWFAKCGSKSIDLVQYVGSLSLLLAKVTRFIFSTPVRAFPI
jgi:hypothetical protein